MGNIYNFFPDLKMRLSVFPCKRYVFVFYDSDKKIYSFDLGNSEYDYIDKRHIPYDILYVAYRKSGIIKKEYYYKLKKIIKFT